MSISPKGWLALLISVALHAMGIGFFWLAAANQEQLAQTLIEFVPADDEPVMTTFVAGQTDVIEMGPQANSTAPRKTEDPPKPGAQASLPNAPGNLAESVKVQTSPIENPGTNSGVQGASKTSGGANVTTTFFNVPAKGQKIVYLIDHSASMGPSGALEVAGQELLASLDRLPSATNFQVIVYNRSANLLIPRFPDWIPAQSDAIKQVARAWRDLPAEGSTDHIRALRMALTLQAEVIFFLTDAGDVRTDLLRDITRLNQGRCAIHVVQLSTGTRSHADSPLQLLAHENRGTFQVVVVR